MMFGNEYDVLDPCGFRGPHPLFGIHIGGIENRRIRCTVSPLPVHKRVWAKVNDRAHFQILPSDLLRTRLHIREVLRERKRCAQHDHANTRQEFCETSGFLFHL